MVGNVTGPPIGVNRRRLLGALCLWFLVKGALVTGVDLGKDEAAYWYWSGDLDASYALAPFTAIAAMDALVPGVDAALRLPFLLGGVLSVALLWHLCRRRGLTEAQALVATAAFATSHWIWHTSSFLHPDGFLVPAWLAVLVAVEQARREGASPAWWYVAGAAAGVAALSKYIGLLLAAGLFLWLSVRALRRDAGPLLRAGPPFVLLAAPVCLDLLTTGFALPSSLTTLSAVAPEGAPVRLLLFVAAPLLYLSPPLLFLLYAAAWRERSTWRQAPHLWIPGALTAATFCLFALGKGQVKGNWILPGLLGVWPLAFSAPWLARRGVAVALVAVGALLTLVPATGLRWPSLAGSLTGSLDGTYTAIVSDRDLPREPTFTWTERLCEYHGWQAFGEDLDAMLAGRAGNSTIASAEYGLAFGAARYADRVTAAALPDDPRFARVAASPSTATVWLGRQGLPAPPGRHLATLTRRGRGCPPRYIEVVELR